MLPHNNTNELLDVLAPTAAKIRERVSHARLHEAYWQILQDADRFHVCLLDEMNLARVKHYFAEVLSSIEDRQNSRTGGYESTKLVAQTLPPGFLQWQEQTMPANFGIVGTVNMDESSHGFSRKVLDRLSRTCSWAVHE